MIAFFLTGLLHHKISMPLGMDRPSERFIPNGMKMLFATLQLPSFNPFGIANPLWVEQFKSSHVVRNEINNTEGLPKKDTSLLITTGNLLLLK